MPYHYNIEQVRKKHTGVLTIVSLSPKIIQECRSWNCVCICGKTFVARSSQIVKIKSCGCLKKHGETGIRLHVIWHGIKQKCQNEYSIHYREYNTLQKEWRSYIGFRDWALANGYDDTKCIKRTKIKLGFNEENCSWYK